MSDSTPGAGATPEQPTPEQPADVVATLKKGNPLDLATIGAGLLAFLASFLPYYTVSVDGFGASSSASATAWNGFFGWFGVVLALAGGVVLAAHLLGRALPVPVRLAVLGLFAAATVSTLLALLVYPGGRCDDGFLGEVCDLIDQGHGVGYWLALLASIAGTALAALRRTAP